MNQLTSPAAQVIISLIPIVGIVIGGVVVFFSLLWHHSEVKMQVRQNNYHREPFNLKTFSLLIGLLLIAVGLILTIVFLCISGKSLSLLGGLIPLAIGISLIVFYAINPDFKDK